MGEPVAAGPAGQVLEFLEEVLPVEGVRIAPPQRCGLLRGPAPLVVAVRVAPPGFLRRVVGPRHAHIVHRRENYRFSYARYNGRAMPDEPRPSPDPPRRLSAWQVVVGVGVVALTFAKYGSSAGAAALALVGGGVALELARTRGQRLAAAAVMAAGGALYVMDLRAL